MPPSSPEEKQEYTCIYKWEDSLTGNNPALNSKYFAFEGELIHNDGHTVEIDPTVFNLLPTQQAVPLVNDIITTFAGGPNVQMMGPYLPADAHTEVVKVRRIIPVPHFLGSLFLAYLPHSPPQT